MLNRRIKFLGSSLPQSRFTIIDYFKILQHIIENSVQYGLEVVDKGCCGTGVVEFAVLCNKLTPVCPDDSKYLYWDSVHLADKGYSIVIDRALQENILL
ncbi:hypothetical protein L1987_32595 [Smallanthus sonchifolius]|uniref:Uncharacterized protein n=1 Tax=Smallanthus sonchifolius TaxID=185202 RepID=A0ACB9HNG7_9ASTR|nr:hypothetical protein L1987_32595 [Smallanthus sonchifolius]